MCEQVKDYSHIISDEILGQFVIDKIKGILSGSGTFYLGLCFNGAKLQYDEPCCKTIPYPSLRYIAY